MDNELKYEDFQLKQIKLTKDVQAEFAWNEHIQKYRMQWTSFMQLSC